MLLSYSNPDAIEALCLATYPGKRRAKARTRQAIKGSIRRQEAARDARQARDYDRG